MIEIIYEDVIIVIKINKKIISLSPDKEIDKCLNFTPQAFESVIFKHFIF
ncbi:hypothetical protein CLOSAC_02940 [Clostridium saccharobutylicum]|uniref:Uncharacterized protein n=1 Tax=Clostridium saccharobutylicum TaxID=169679 RepID=A0A1S8NI09_CLOSA|nr:hypothetical protein CLOSAC_02940 [Clostridium saccharobutylicum]